MCNTTVLIKTQKYLFFALREEPGGKTMAEAIRTDDKDRDDLKASLERYLLMNEKEKDEEIQKAVVRLQKRVQEIIYLLETDLQHDRGPQPGERDPK
jgi:hypothetical protein